MLHGARCVPTSLMQSKGQTRHTRVYGQRSSGPLLNHVSIRNAISGGTISVEGHTSGPILTDTRRADVRGAWFVALTGPSYDGHDFVGECLSKDVAGVIVSNQWLRSSRTSAALLRQAAAKRIGVVAVPDTQTALTELCKFVMSCYHHAVIAITGSCGKTTCKDMVACALSFYCPDVHQAPGSYNNHIGVPLTALSTPQKSPVAIFEFGTSGQGEIEALSKLINPQIRVITDIQPAHLQGLKGIKGVAQEKLQLFQTAQEGDQLVFNAANADVWEMLESATDNINMLNLWAFAGTAALTGLLALHNKNHSIQCPLIEGYTQATVLMYNGHAWEPLTTIVLSCCPVRDDRHVSSRGRRIWKRVNHVGRQFVFHVPALGDHLAVNAAAAVAATCACLQKQLVDAQLDATNDATLEALLQLANSVLTKLEDGKWLGDWTPPSGRMCVYHVTDHLVILDDSHNANPASMFSALKTLERLVVNTSGQAVRRLAVLGAMSELGSVEATYHQKMAASASLLPAIDVIFWGDEWNCSVSASAGAEVQEVSGRLCMHIPGTHKQALVNAIMRWIRVDTRDEQVAIILLKGSRTAKMELVMQFMQAQAS